jgi:hypothetical protein
MCIGQSAEAVGFSDTRPQVGQCVPDFGEEAADLLAEPSQVRAGVRHAGKAIELDSDVGEAGANPVVKGSCQPLTLGFRAMTPEALEPQRVVDG